MWSCVCVWGGGGSTTCIQGLKAQVKAQKLRGEGGREGRQVAAHAPARYTYKAVKTPIPHPLSLLLNDYYGIIIMMMIY